MKARSLEDLIEALNLPFPGDAVHQSFLSGYRHCHAYGLFSLAQGRSGGNAYTLLGSMFHSAAEDCFNLEGNAVIFRSIMDWRYWNEKINDMLFKQDMQSPFGNKSVEYVARKLCDRDTYNGKNVGDLVREVYIMVKSAGFKVLASEVHAKLIIRGEDDPNPLCHQGTMDLLLKGPMGTIIPDIKTSGMWNPIVKGKAVTASAISSEAIEHTTQLRHYHWLGWRSGLFGLNDISHYCIIKPSQLVPYRNKVGSRGTSFIFGTASAAHVLRYEEDLISWMKMIAGGNWQRMYPQIYGKSECPGCRFKPSCLDQTASEEVPDYIQQT